MKALSSATSRPRRLLLVQRRLTHYRVPFFEQLRDALARHGVDLVLVVGTPTEEEQLKRDAGELPWAVQIPCRYALKGKLCWQPLDAALPGADLVVLDQENRMLHNYGQLLLPQRHRVALWCHGRNFQARPSALSHAAQWAKAALTRRADWWFAYTDVSARVMASFGTPMARTTVLNNAIDTRTLAEQLTQARHQPLAALRAALGLHDGPVGLFIGSLYPDKRLDLLLDAAHRLHQRLPGFQLVIAGAGPMFEATRADAAAHRWIHMTGAVHGARKAEWLACADVLMNPGLVGLGILDAFTAQVPLVTTDCKVHSPEIAYLEPGVNGLISVPSGAAFAEAVASVITDPALAQRLRQGCHDAAQTYHLDAMVSRFVDGTLRWAASPRITPPTMPQAAPARP